MQVFFSLLFACSGSHVRDHFAAFYTKESLLGTAFDLRGKCMGIALFLSDLDYKLQISNLFGYEPSKVVEAPA